MAASMSRSWSGGEAETAGAADFLEAGVDLVGRLDLAMGGCLSDGVKERIDPSVSLCIVGTVIVKKKTGKSGKVREWIRTRFCKQNRGTRQIGACKHAPYIFIHRVS